MMASVLDLAWKLGLRNPECTLAAGFFPYILVVAATGVWPTERVWDRLIHLYNK